MPGGTDILCATERLLELAALHPLDPALTAGIPATILPPADRESALRELIRGRLGCLGPGPRPGP